MVNITECSRHSVSTELLKSADCYGVSRARVTVIDHEQLQDGKQNDWPPQLISNIVRSHILRNDTDMVRNEPHEHFKDYIPSCIYDLKYR